MQKFILTFALILFALISKAQTEKGTIYTGGSLSFSSYNYDYGNTNGFSRGKQTTLMPTVGIFLNSKWAIGITPIYTYQRDTSYSQSQGYTSTYTARSQMLGGSLELRYYFNITDKFVFYPTLAASYLTGLNHEVNKSSHAYSAKLTPSFAYFITRKLALNMTVGAIQWSTQINKLKVDDTEDKYTAFTASANNTLALGFAYHFTR